MESCRPATEAVTRKDHNFHRAPTPASLLTDLCAFLMASGLPRVKKLESIIALEHTFYATVAGKTSSQYTTSRHNFIHLFTDLGYLLNIHGLGSNSDGFVAQGCKPQMGDLGLWGAVRRMGGQGEAASTVGPAGFEGGCAQARSNQETPAAGPDVGSSRCVELPSEPGRLDLLLYSCSPGNRWPRARQKAYRPGQAQPLPGPI